MVTVELRSASLNSVTGVHYLHCDVLAVNDIIVFLSTGVPKRATRRVGEETSDFTPLNLFKSFFIPRNLLDDVWDVQISVYMWPRPPV